MSTRLLLLSPPVWIAALVAIEWARARKHPTPLAELLEGDVS